MIVNNGIINNGNNNINISNVNFDFEEMSRELEILDKHCDEDLNEAKEAIKEKNISKLSLILKGLKESTFELIGRLGLPALEKLIKYLF